MDGCSLRSCIVGDEHALALVGQATFLETFAGILDGADILAHCHTQHTAAVYAAWLRERAGSLWLAETTAGVSLRLDISGLARPSCRCQMLARLTSN
jgi:hypothetical protein